MNTIVIAIKYDEPEWDRTWKCLVACGCPILVVSRDGIGSMAKAYNKAFFENYELIKRYKYVWFVSNVEFAKDMLSNLEEGMNKSRFAAIHPSFKSDHQHLKPLKQNVLKLVPFVEFTCPIVRTEVFNNFPLDEDMPFVGHDLDWGYRVRKEGYLIGVHHGVEAHHTYIRHNKNPQRVTEMRKQLRSLWSTHTQNKLVEKYGKSWKTVLGYKYNI